MDKTKAVLVAAGTAIIPVAAFLIRMYEGDTHNENEEVISKFVQNYVNNKIMNRSKHDDPS